MENTSKHTKLSTKIQSYSSMEHTEALYVWMRTYIYRSVRTYVRMYVIIVKLPFHNSITHTDEWVRCRTSEKMGRWVWVYIHKNYGVRRLAWISDKGI